MALLGRKRKEQREEHEAATKKARKHKRDAKEMSPSELDRAMRDAAEAHERRPFKKGGHCKGKGAATQGTKFRGLR